MKDLNRAVTEAIFAAEEHERAGAILWEHVARCERAIAQSTDPDISDSERDIAAAGACIAGERARAIRGSG